MGTSCAMAATVVTGAGGRSNPCAGFLEFALVTATNIDAPITTTTAATTATQIF